MHAKIDIQRRQKISNNHSATHLLQWALCQILGEHVKQQGSFVDEKRLRFDFNHHKALSYEEIKKVEIMVNAEIRKNILVKIYETSYEEAQKDTSIKQVFGEKYEKTVRVVDMDVCKELCGGCHTSRSGNIGFFKIAKESSIAAGVRRIEAVTGQEAENFVYEKQEFIMYLEDILKINSSKIPARLEILLKENKDLNLSVKTLHKNQIKVLKDKILQSKEKIKDITFIAQEVDISSQELVPLAIELLDQIQSGIIVLAISQKDKKCQILIKISKDIVEKGIMADLMIDEISSLIKGGGGGKMDMAQAGGKDSTKINEAFKLLRSFVEKKC